jgi:ribose transport system substrate-binding protein
MWVVLALILLLAFASLAVAACGEDETTAEPEATASGTADSGGPAVKKIGISFPNSSKEGAVQFEMGFAVEEGKKLGYEVVVDDPGSDANKQLNTVNTWIAAKYPAIVVVALDSGPFQNIVGPAKESGTKWVSYGAPMPGESGQIDMNQIPGGETLGKLAGEWFKANIDGTAKVALLTYEAGEWARLREEGITKGLDASGCDYEIVAKQDALSETEGLEKTTLILQANPDLNGVLAIEETASEGAYQAFLNAGHPKDDPKVWLGGIDGTLKALTLLAEGNTMYRGSAALSLAQLGAGMTQTAVKLAEGSDWEVYKVQYTPLEAGDPEVQTFLSEWGQ